MNRICWAHSRILGIRNWLSK